jgi:virginiamycin B lyase
MIRFAKALATALAILKAGGTAHAKMVIQTFAVLAGAGAHDVYPAPDGTVWFTRNPQATSAVSIPEPASRI